MEMKCRTCKVGELCTNIDCKKTHCELCTDYQKMARKHERINY